MSRFSLKVARRFLGVALLAGVWLVVGSEFERVCGDEPFPTTMPKVKSYDWMLSPAAESSPSLKHKFHVDLADSTPGNAAAFYSRAIISILQTNRSAVPWHEHQEWFEMPLDQLPLDDVRKVVEHNRVVFEELKSAAYCEASEWGTRFQDLRGMNVVEARLMEFQETRDLARILRLKARLAIAEKRYEDAIASIRDSFQLSNSLASVPNVIAGLISVAIRTVTFESVMELMSAENSPNLYWALRGLPDATQGVMSASRFESTMAFRIFPFLKDAETAQRPAEEWNRLLTDVVTSLDDSSPPWPNDALSMRLRVVSMIAKSYPIAKRELAEAGYDRNRLEQMPVGQVVAIYTRKCHEHVVDEYLKWTLVPFADGYKQLQHSREKLINNGYLGHGGDEVPSHDPLLINDRLGYIPAQISQACNRQRFLAAALMAVEAIRLHAAENGGQLPTSLDRITAVPVPLDPSTGKPFLYRVVEQRAELLVLPSDGTEYSGRRFQFRMRSKDRQ